MKDTPVKMSVRVPRKLHENAKVKAARQGMTLEAFVIEAMLAHLRTKAIST